MPIYLIHGFRWTRQNIRIHVIVNDLEDAAPEWIVAPATSITLLNSFYSSFDFIPPSNPPPATYPIPILPQAVWEEPPEERSRSRTKSTSPTKKRNKSLVSLASRRKPSLTPSIPSSLPASTAAFNGNGAPNMPPRPSTADHRPLSASANKIEKSETLPPFNDWSVVKLVEQYDPDDLSMSSQPFAYVGDYVVEVGLGASVTEHMARFETKVKRDEENLPKTPNRDSTASSLLSPALSPGPRSPALSAREVRRMHRRLGWLEKLRDKLEANEEIGWYVVYCGDLERLSPTTESESSFSLTSRPSGDAPRSAGLRGFFSRRNVNRGTKKQ